MLLGHISGEKAPCRGRREGLQVQAIRIQAKSRRDADISQRESSVLVFSHAGKWLAAATICVFSETDPGASSVNVCLSRSRSAFVSSLSLCMALICICLGFKDIFVLQGAYENRRCSSSAVMRISFLNRMMKCDVMSKKCVDSDRSRLRRRSDVSCSTDDGVSDS